MISSWRRTRRWLSPYPPGRSQIASLSLRIHVKWRGVIPSAHLPRSLGGISAALRCRWWVRAALREPMLLGALDNAEPLPASLDPATVGQFARHRLPARDRQYALDTGCVGRIPLDGEPAPQCTPSDRNRGGCDRHRVRRVETGGELLQDRAVVAKQARGAGEERRQVA